ncbi:phosphotransferase [Plantactinospora sp. GCM10030261]|uniref:protein kinase domain-containing protein n=1 Tax=Plantactinospora sp. GCM10030261 TaxID=3273420 RepID=UPI0036203666
MTVEYVHETRDAKVWALFVRMPDDLQVALGESRELLVYVAEYGKFQAREIDRASELVRDQGARLSRSIGVILTADKRTGEQVMEVGEESETFFIGFSIDRIRTCRPLGEDDFRILLQAQAYGRDLYDLPGAVTRSRDFFGRRRLVERLKQEIAMGSAHQGIFGLRKIGKTSLVNRLAQLVREDGRCFVAQIDLQRAAAIRPDAQYIMWSIGQAIYDSHRHIRDIRSLRMFGRYELFSDIEPTESVYELFDHDLRQVLAVRKRRIVVILDEIERILPPTGNARLEQEFVRLWRVLRGLDQQLPNRLSFVISGTNPKCVEDAKVGDEDNPIYNYFTREYLKPLSLGEAGDLLNSIGHKIGIEWPTLSVSEAFAQTGGHPALLRAMGSIVHRQNLNRRRQVAVGRDEVRNVSQVLLVERAPLLAQLVSTLKDEYADEYYLLSLLAQGRVHDFKELASEFPSDIAHLVGYGICSELSGVPRLGIRILQTYLQRQLSQQRPDRSRRDVLEAGESVSDYLIEGQVGRRGGLATVYKGRNVGTKETVAIKVVRSGKLSTVQRELDILQTITHRNIVKVIEAGILDDGNPFLVMEYVEGPTLADFCDASSRPTEHALLRWAVDLLSALESIHPRPTQVEEIRKQHDELDGDVVQAIFEAQHGVIHRDIKPENVILHKSRGPVLIDFNISVRAGDPVKTVSATPGYLPPALLLNSWSHEVDLYQLGATLLQLAAGNRLDDASMCDLDILAKRNLSRRGYELISRLLLFDQTGGYRLTSEALRDARQALSSLGRQG